MGRKLHIFEAAMGPMFAATRHLAFIELLPEIHEGLEMRLADQGGTVTRLFM